MAYDVLLTASAETDLDSIGEYLAVTLANPPAATKFFSSADSVISILSDNPFLFPICSDAYLRVRSYRSVGIENYLAIYKVDRRANKVYVLRIFHQSQNYPDHMKNE